MVSRIFRGYVVSDDEINISLEAFKSEFAANGQVDRKALNFYAQLAEDPSIRVFVYYADERNVGVKTMRSFVQTLETHDITRGIILWSDKMTTSAKKVTEAMRLTFTLEDFQETQLLVNITQHYLVPQHEVMTKEQKAELLQRYRLKETQLPRIRLDDPVARYFGLQRGEVVKITRPSETSGRYCSYRICLS
ncbi:probable 25 kd subunit of dna-directed rna polymerases ii and iii [Ceraceosorus bombacis]|uniref:DNA-directed RNA polymerases I, II, and III subunit RPABC1 n=1 Tax=Ceraceosorus bombacis TaxID=401625 RepID=A0A0P1BL80_9BASI|nr:probable 25 kd subunit of dna-directed rna polymerases ii and iii [Ceraceosorus bombacis]